MYSYSKKLVQGVHHWLLLMKYVVLKLYNEHC